MHKKLVIFFILLLFVLFSLTAGGTKEDKLHIGCVIYRFDDTFMTEVRNAIARASTGKVVIEIENCQNMQSLQNDIIERFLDEGCDALAINPVDRTAAGVLIEKAKKANVPIVFFNREPLAEDMAAWDKVYYVGANAEASGTISGQILADYWLSHPEADLNGDGVMQYVILKGEPGHQDAELRTEYSCKCLSDNGIILEKLAEENGQWLRETGKEKMRAFLSSFDDRIEAVLANNDDMALGAIDALKEAGYFQHGRYLPVVGVDATSQALAALQEGTLLGTVLNDSVGQGKVVFSFAYQLAEGKTPHLDSSDGYLVDGQYVWVPYKKVTKSELPII